MLLDAAADITFFTETWLRDEHQDIVNDLTQPGFEFKKLNRSQKRGGGLGVLHRSSLNLVVRRSAVTPTHFEVLQLSCDKPSYYFVLIYRPPSSNTSDFLNEFEDLVTSFAIIPGRLLILGDFNIHFDDALSPGVSRITNIMASTGLVQHMTGSTHRSSHTLDVVISRKEDTILTSPAVILPNTFSDHHTIIFSIEGDAPRLPTNKWRGRDYRHVNLDLFKSDLHAAITSHDDNISDGVDDLLQQFEHSVSATLDIHAPVVSRTRKSKKSQPWFDDETLCLRRKRRALERKWRLSGLEIDKQIYTSQINNVKQHIRNAKVAYYDAALNNADAKTTFQVLHSLTESSDRKLPDRKNDEILCNGFVEFFEEKIQKVVGFTRSKVTIEGIVMPTLPAAPPALQSLNSLCSTDAEELQAIIKSRPMKCCPLDVLPTWLLKTTLTATLSTLVNIVNASLITGTFPKQFKTALVTPLLKKASLDQNELGNYRPISNLAFIGKLIEHVVLKRLNQHMTTNNLHDKMQSAYKQHHSTETALMRVQHDIVRNLDSGRCVMLVLLDTSAAFDTINIDILLNTLGSRFNIGGTALDWFRSYLTGRSQCVTVGSSSSITTLIYHGVPQGSVLGPVMFNMYTTSIADICMKNHVLFHRFADDTQLYVSYNPMMSDELENAKQLIIQCIAEIRAWMLLHQLKLNNEKTEFIVLQSPHNLRVYGSPSLELPGLTLTSTDAVRNLGCYFDRHMQLDRLVSSYCSSAYYHLRLISRIRHLLTRDACHAAIRCLVLSRLDYCNGLLGGLNNGLTNRLQQAQNSAARVINRVRRRDHVTPILRSLHWLPIKMRVTFKICTCMYKILHGLAPDYLNCAIARNAPTRALRSASDTTLLAVTVPRRTVGRCSFTVAGPTMWNSLPKSVRTTETLAAFRKQLKTHLFRSHYLP